MHAETPDMANGQQLLHRLLLSLWCRFPIHWFTRFCKLTVQFPSGHLLPLLVQLLLLWSVCDYSELLPLRCLQCKTLVQCFTIYPKLFACLGFTNSFSPFKKYLIGWKTLWLFWAIDLNLFSAMFPCTRLGDAVCGVSWWYAVCHLDMRDFAGSWGIFLYTRRAR